MHATTTSHESSGGTLSVVRDVSQMSAAGNNMTSVVIRVKRDNAPPTVIPTGLLTQGGTFEVVGVAHNNDQLLSFLARRTDIPFGVAPMTSNHEHMKNVSFDVAVLMMRPEKPAFDGEQKIHSNHNLSRREVEIVRLIVDGKSTLEIAEALFISEHTVKTHRRNIFKKLNIRRSAQLATFAISVGLVAY